jgi:O-antigen/teichoic acid export membrane protein
MSEAAAPQLPPGTRAREPKGSLARNALHLVLGQAGTTALAVLLSAALGRALGAAEFGLYYVVSAPWGLAYVLIEWGQTPYIIREVARHPDRAGDLLGTGLALRVAGTLFLTGIIAAVLPLFGYDPRTQGLSALFIVTSLPFLLAQAYGLVFRARERMDLDATVSVVNKVLVLGLTVAALALKGGLAGAIVAQGVAGLGAIGVAAFLLTRISAPRLRASLAVVKELLVGGAPMVTMSLANATQSYLDVLILSRLSPVESVGWYGAARNIFGTLAAAAFILGSASFPRLSRAAHEPARFRQELEAGLRPLLGVAALVGVGSYLFADFAVGLVFGKARFAPAATILQASGPGQVLLFLDVLFASALIAVGRAKRLALVKGLSLLATVALDLLLVPFFQRHYGNGGLGLVVAFAGTELFMFAGVFYLLPRGLLSPLLALDVGRAAVASAGTLLLFRVLPPLTAWVGMPLCVLVFLGLAAAVGLVRRAELESLRAILRRPKGG